MRIHYLQHAPFEDLANIATWAMDKGHTVTSTQLYLDEDLPAVHEFDWLIIMGGPMNVYEETRYPWLTKEKKFVKEVINNDKLVLGICLGAQLLVDVLGGTVQRNEYTEIGWFPVRKTETANSSPIFRQLPEEMMTFHWHGDTFSLPPGVRSLFQSDACANQGFAYNNRVIGLQFHPEVSEPMVRKLVESCGDELVDGEYIQTGHSIIGNLHYVSENKSILYQLLNEIEKQLTLP